MYSTFIKTKSMNLLKIKTLLLKNMEVSGRLGFIDFNEFIEDWHPWQMTSGLRTTFLEGKG